MAYISGQKLESERSKSLAVSISMQTKTIRSKFRVSGTGKYPPNSGKSSRSWKLKSRCAQGGLSYSCSLKVKLGYILGQKLEDKRSKNFALSISLQTKAIRNKFRVHRTGKYSLISGKSSRSWSKSRSAYGGLGSSFTLQVKWGYISA